VYLFLGAYTLYIKPRDRLNQVFALLCGTFTLWNLALMFIATAQAKQEVWLWYRVSAVSWIYGPAVLLHFFVLLTTQAADVRRMWWLLPLLYGVATVFFIQAMTGTVYAVDFAPTPCGWDEVVRLDAWGVTYLGFYSASAAAGLWLVYRWGATTRLPRARRQARIILLSAIPVLILISISNIGLRMLDIHLTPGLAPILLPIWGVCIFYAIVRYDLMALNPATAAREVLATMADGLLLLGRDNRVLGCNRSATELIGVDEDGLIGTPVTRLFPGSADLFGPDLQERLAASPIRSAELEFATAERVIPLGLSASQVTDTFGQPIGVVVIFRDMSEVRRLEDNLQQAAKLEAMGKLAGGIAHDFNNLLAVMLTEAQLIRLDTEAPELRESARAIETAAQRAAELTASLLGFARRGKSRNVEVDLHHTIHETVRMLHRTLPKNIAISLELAADRTVVMGDPSQLQQVLLNLALNGRDAMPDGGTLTFRTASRSLSPEAEGPLVTSRDQRQQIELEVSDTGRGVDPRDLPRIFEPFFTTKEEGRGTGMGLAMAYGIVANHGGTISARSQPGRGTSFRVHLPVHEAELQLDETSQGMPLLVGSGAVLVVDDEQMVRHTAETVLTRLGYKVATAAGGEEAVSYFREHHETVDLVLLDMLMPGMDGEECFEQLRAIDPKVKTLIISGYAGQDAVQGMLEKGARGFVQKPFTIERLATALHEALHG
jgi:PAS domain S-box-containing protein